MEQGETWQALSRLARLQIFFVGGAPRTGTTWLQLLLDAHPDVSCRGEALFMKHLAAPLDAMTASWRQGLEEKNRRFAGPPYPPPENADFLLATAILLAMERQREGKACVAIGEKTPENVFFFPRLKQLFTNAKFIGIARDPRDSLASAWHYFRTPKGTEGEAAKIAYLREALPSLQEGARALLALRQNYPADTMVVTYERLVADPAGIAAALFRFLGVADGERVVADCVARTAFRALSGGRPAGTAQHGAFFRKGVVGDWRATFSPAIGDLILAQLGWTFPHFGWTR
jgi:Sulfotransferase family